MSKFLRKHSDTPLHTIKKNEFNDTDKTLQLLARGDTQTSNGYQQVPIVIESQDNKTTRPTSSKLHIPLNPDMVSFEKEIIDIRSYLSQSRCNMSPFARSSSYRSQYGRPTNIEVSFGVIFFEAFLS